LVTNCTLAAKHFIVDDICCYIGSQNLYICDLAEWGVVIDDPRQVQSIKAQYWDPMWKTSLLKDDCNVQAVMDGLKIDRTAPSKLELTKIQLEQMKEKVRATSNVPTQSKFHAKKKEEGEDDDDADDEVSEAED
jgi:phosphatidylserine/phosphatidylglycerophosphate/cardiolipin synthase-like enzyme